MATRQSYRTLPTRRRQDENTYDYMPGAADASAYQDYYAPPVAQPTNAPVGGPGGWTEQYGVADPGDPESMIQQSWLRTVGRGDVLNQEGKDRASQDRQRYQGINDYMDPMMRDWAEGRGGYSPEEQASIMREQELNGVMATPEDLGGYYQTGAERDAISGDPWMRANYFRPDDMSARQRESETAQRGAVDTMQDRLYEAAGSPGLDISRDYLNYTGNAMDSMGRGVRGAIDPARLRTSEAALNDIRMSPEEQQGYVDSASITAGKAYRANLQDMEARQRAAGVPQAGIGAQRLRYLRNEAADMGDAAAQARLGAGAEKARRAGVAEQMRQGGEDLYTGYAVPAEMQLGQTALATGRDVEGMRMDSARDIANRYERAATGVGSARAGTESDIYGQRQRTGEYITNTGTGILTGIERDASDRAAALSGNRQQTARDVVNTRYGQGYDVNNALSGRAAGVAGQRLNAQSEGRNYFANAGQLASGREQTEQAGRRQIYGTQVAGMQGPTNQSMQYDQRPRAWEKAVGFGLGVIGSVGIPGLGGGQKKAPYSYGTGGW